MTILQLCSKSPYPPTDGGSIAISSIIQGYSDFGHSISILAINTPKHFADPEKISKLLPERTTIKLVNVDTGIKLFKALINFIFSTKPYHIKRFYSRKLEYALIDILKHQKFDMVQIEGLYVTPYIPVIKNYTDAIICYRAHNIESEIWERIALTEKNLIKRFYLLNLAKRLKKFEISIINNYTALIPITKRDSEVFAKFGNFKPVYIVPAGISIKESNTYDTIKYPSLCFIGALDWIPNQQGLMWFIENVWPIISRHNKDIQLHVAGRNAPDWLVKRINISNINYFGEVNDAYQFLNKYAIMIVPLFSGSGMRVKIIESLYLGKAIVSTSIGAEGIDITHRQNILIADTPEEFSDCILELCQKNDFYNEICKNARELVIQKYDNNKIIDNLLKFIGSL